MVKTFGKKLTVLLSFRTVRLVLCLVSLAACLLLAGCDPVTRHKTLTTIFDGVPSLPEPAELCREYVEKQAQMATAPATSGEDKESAGKKTSSIHAPYEEKRCNDCHNTNEEKSGGLILPARELCLSCHTGFIKGSFVHGPVAVGECLACHLPHSSSLPSLLIKNKNEICAGCHREKRLALAMHNNFVARRIDCVECHDPHYGNAHFFLK
jgi:predicted CXXCH cytochrome family protein